MRRNGPLIHVADVSMIPRIKTIENERGWLSPVTFNTEGRGGTSQTGDSDKGERKAEYIETVPF